MTIAAPESSRKRLILHIGYPKTGTTTLQGAVFPNLSGVDYWGKPKRYGRIAGGDASVPGNVHGVLRAVSFEDSAGFAARREALLDGLRRRVCANAAPAAVLSCEDLVRPVASSQRVGAAVEPAAVAERLGELFAHGLADLCDVHVLITLRRQCELVPSYYAQFAADDIASGRYQGGFDNFVSLCCNGPNGPVPRFLSFASVMAQYQELFGRDGVTVLPMEGLFDPRDDWARRNVADLVGEDLEALNARMLGPAKRVKGQVSDGQADVKRYIAFREAIGLRGKLWHAIDWTVPKGPVKRRESSAFARRFRKLGKRYRPQERFDVDDAVRARISTAFAETNRCLDRDLGLQLQRYEYY